MISPDGGVISTRFYLEGKRLTSEEIIEATVNISGEGIVDQEHLCQVAENGIVYLEIDGTLIPETTPQITALFQVSTESEKLEKAIVYEVGKRAFDLDVDFIHLLHICPDLDEYAWEKDPYFSQQRHAALDELLHRIGGQGAMEINDNNLEALKLPFIYLWLAHIHSSLSKDSEDIFSHKSNEFNEKYIELFRDTDFLRVERTPQRTKLKRG
jgi:hypothetical protein